MTDPALHEQEDDIRCLGLKIGYPRREKIGDWISSRTTIAAQQFTQSQTAKTEAEMLKKLPTGVRWEPTCTAWTDHKALGVSSAWCLVSSFGCF